MLLLLRRVSPNQVHVLKSLTANLFLCSMVKKTLGRRRGGGGGGEGWLKIKIGGNEIIGKTLPSKVKLQAKTAFKNV